MTLVAAGGDFAGGPDEAAKDRLFLNDSGVMADPGGERHDIGKPREISGPARTLQLVSLLEQIGDGDEVLRVVLFTQGQHGGIDLLVGVAVEIVRREQSDNLFEHALLHEDGTEDALFGLQAVRW